MGTLERVYLIGVLLFAVTAVLISCAFLASEEPRQTVGTIKDTFRRSDGTYVQYPVGADRSFRTPANIPISESVVFEITAEGLDEPVRYSTNTVHAEQFKVGQRVLIEYIERGIPFIWKRVYVTNMEAVAK